MSKCKYCGKEIVWRNLSLDDTIPCWKAYEIEGEKIYLHKCKEFKKLRQQTWIKNHMKQIIEQRKMNRDFHNTVK